MSIVTLPIPAPHTPKGEQSCFRSKLAMWVAETSVLFYHEVDGQDKLKAASLPISMGLLGEQIDKLDALFPETFKIPRSPDGGSTTVTFSELLGRPELQTAFLRAHLITHSLDPNRYGDFEITEDGQILSVICKQDKTCCCRADCLKFKLGQCSGIYWSKGQSPVEIKHIMLNQPVTLRLNKQRLELPDGCECHGAPVPSFDCSDIKCPAGQYSMPLALCVIRDSDQDCLRNCESLANAYGLDHQVIEALVFASMLCKSFYQAPQQNDEVTKLVMDEFRGQTDFTSMMVDAERRKVLAMVEGKTKPSIRKMMELGTLVHNINLRMFASDNNAAFQDVARTIFGDDFQWCLDPFHLLQSMTLVTFTPVLRGQLTRHRNTMNGKVKDEYQFLDFAQHINDILAAYSDFKGDFTSRASIYMKHAIMSDDPNYIAESKDIPQATKDYILNHPLFSKMLDLAQLVRRSIKSDNLDEATLGLAMAVAQASELKQLSPKYLGKLQGFAKSLERNMTGILNYVKTKLTSSIIEGFNSKIKLIKRSLRGYRNPVFFMLRCSFAFKGKVA